MVAKLQIQTDALSAEGKRKRTLTWQGISHLPLQKTRNGCQFNGDYVGQDALTRHDTTME